MKKFYISFAIAFVLIIHLVSLFAMADSYTYSHSESVISFTASSSSMMSNNMNQLTDTHESGSDLVFGNPGKYSISSKLYYTPIR